MKALKSTTIIFLALLILLAALIPLIGFLKSSATSWNIYDSNKSYEEFLEQLFGIDITVLPNGEILFQPNGRNVNSSSTIIIEGTYHYGK